MYPKFSKGGFKGPNFDEVLSSFKKRRKEKKNSSTRWAEEAD